jgi:hypothetical protein
MILSELKSLYDVWKGAKSGIGKVTGSGSYKILMISGRVDHLIAEYSVYKQIPNKTVLTSILARMKQIKEELTALVTAVPKVPKFSKNAAKDSIESALETHNTSEMAKMELMRVYTEQLNGALPDDETSYWPSRRARLVQGRDAFRGAAIEQENLERSIQKDIDAEERQQSLLRTERDAPGIKGDRAQIDMLSEDYDKSIKGEAELSEQLRGAKARAEMFAKMSANLDQLIEAGDLTHKKK